MEDAKLLIITIKARAASLLEMTEKGEKYSKLLNQSLMIQKELKDLSRIVIEKHVKENVAPRIEDSELFIDEFLKSFGGEQLPHNS